MLDVLPFSLHPSWEGDHGHEDEETKDRVLLPEVLTVLAQVKEENRPWLIRELLPTVNRLEYAEAVMEWRTIKKERL